jgi:hypothetical protein
VCPSSGGSRETRVCTTSECEKTLTGVGIAVIRAADRSRNISVAMSQEPCDVMITGTPGGIGAPHRPPVFMQPRDVFEVEIKGMGVVSNPSQDA